MSDFSRERRLLLLGGVAWVGGLAAVSARPAGAAMQQVEIPRGSPFGAAIANRCSADAEHADIAARLRAELAADPSLKSASAECPICGCPVVVSR
jgi:hypothetical protein